MKRVIVNIPDKKEEFLLNLFKKHHLEIQVIEEEDENIMAKWIEEGMKSGEVSEDEVLQTLRKYGAEI